MALLKITKDGFESLKAESRPVLIDFYADWCMPCQMMSPVVSELAQERDDCIVGKVNVDDEQELAIKFGVESIPMFVVMKNGEVISKRVGTCTKEQLAEMIDKA